VCGVFLSFFLDTHLLAKLLKDDENYITWLTHCLLASSSSSVVDLKPESFLFPFKVGRENGLTIDELHNSYKSWMDERRYFHDIQYKSIVSFHKSLTAIAPNCVPENCVTTGESFNLDWFEFERGILKSRLDLDPYDEDNIENSPFRRVCQPKFNNF
jgi:hypothetical protein